MATSKTISYEGFWRAVTNTGKLPCALKGSVCHRCEGTGYSGQLRLGQFEESECQVCKGRGVMPCSRILDAHHFVPKRRLRTDQAKQDTRNGVPLCRDHHDLVEGLMVRCPRPPQLAFFLTDHGIAPGLVPEAADAAPVLTLRR